jgi:uncharacterized protein YggU (UPF0235/DUF167 family)
LLAPYRPIRVCSSLAPCQPPQIALARSPPIYETASEIKLRAPALEGKANAALRSFLAGELKISEHRILLQHGQKSREKIIRIEGLSEEDARRQLLATI